VENHSPEVSRPHNSTATRVRSSRQVGEGAPGAPWGVHLLEGAEADSPEIFCNQKFSGLSAVPGAGGSRVGGMPTIQKDHEEEVQRALKVAGEVAARFQGVRPEEVLGAAWEALHTSAQGSRRSPWWRAFEAAGDLLHPDGRHRAAITAVRPRVDDDDAPPEPCDEEDLEDSCLALFLTARLRSHLERAKNADRLVVVFDRLVADADLDEIAAELGVSRRSVERAVREIRELLAPARAEILGAA